MKPRRRTDSWLQRQQCQCHLSGASLAAPETLRHDRPMALIINGEQIDEEIIESEFRQIKGHFERTLQVACCERDPEFRGKAKDNIASVSYTHLTLPTSDLV